MCSSDLPAVRRGAVGCSGSPPALGGGAEGGGGSPPAGWSAAVGGGGTLPQVGSGAPGGAWRLWSPCTSVPHLPRGLWIPPDPQASAHAALTHLQGSWAADRIYDSVDALARALRAELAGFAPWQRVDPSYQPTLSGWVWTPDGPRRVSVMLDTGATH